MCIACNDTSVIVINFQKSKTHAITDTYYILITSDQRRANSYATVRDFCPALIAPDQACFIRGTVFFSPRISGMVLFLARVVHASFAWRTSTKHILQTLEAILSLSG